MLLSLFTFLSFVQVQAAQYAVVTAVQATIYADKQLLAPIGFIKQGKKILVGEVARQYGTILPVSVAGRIAYIQVKDIATTKRLKNDDTIPQGESRASHSFYDTMGSNGQDNLKEDNYVGLELGTSTMTEDWKALSDLLGQSNPTVANGRFFFEHRPTFRRTSWSFGLIAQSATGTEAKYSGLGFDFHINYSLFKSDLINIDVGFAPTLIALSTLQFKGPPSEEFKGSAWGYGLIGRCILFPNSKISLHGSAFYQRLSFENFDDIPVSGLGRTVSLSSSSNIGVSVAMAWGFDL